MAYEAERRIILSHQRLLADVRARVTAFASKQYVDLGSWRDADIERFIAKVVPVVEAGQIKTAGLTQSYLAAMARMSGIKPLPTAKLPANLRGVALEEVYRRPAVATYTALSKGASLDEAVALGQTRVEQLVAMDMQMANVRSAFETVSNDQRVVGWQRVLSGGENCALCAIASTQRYHSEDLMPIHDRCSCDVAPIYGSKDPGQVINAERLSDAQSALEAQGLNYTGGEFKSDRSVRVENHGEYGPVLTWADQKFTGPEDL
jgi:hypothetical protein